MKTPIIIAVDKSEDKNSLCYVTFKDVETGKEWSGHMTQKAYAFKQLFSRLVHEMKYNEELLQNLCNFVVEARDEDLNYTD